MRIAFAILALVAAQPLFGQEQPSRDLRVEVKSLRIGFKTDGKPGLYTMETLEFSVLDRVLSLVSLDVVREELEILPYQKKDWDEINSQFRSISSTLWNRLSSPLSGDEREIVLREATDGRDAIRKKLTDVLMPHQLEELQHISVFLDYHARGFDAFLKGHRSELDLSIGIAESQDISAKAEELLREYATRFEEKYAAALDQLLAIAENKIEAHVVEHYDGFKDGLWIDVMLANTDLLDAAADKKDATPLATQLRALIWYELGPDQNWHRKQSNRMEAASLSGYILMLQEAPEGLQVSESQGAAVESRKSEYGRQYREIDDRYRAAIQDGVDRDAAFSEFRDGIGRLDDELEHQLSVILTPQQREWLFQLRKQNWLGQYGLLGFIANRDDSGSENDNESNQEDMRKAGKVLELLKRELIDMEDELLEKELELLPAPDRKKVKEYLGERPGFLMPSYAKLASRIKR